MASYRRTGRRTVPRTSFPRRGPGMRSGRRTIPGQPHVRLVGRPVAKNGIRKVRGGGTYRVMYSGRAGRSY